MEVGYAWVGERKLIKMMNVRDAKVERGDEYRLLSA